MNSRSIIALGFGVLATIFVIYLLKGIVVLLSYKMKGDGSDFKAIVTIFKIPLIALLALVLFIAFIIPMLE